MEIQRLPMAQAAAAGTGRIPKDRDGRRQNQQGQQGQKSKDEKRQALEHALDGLADQLNHYTE